MCFGEANQEKDVVAIGCGSGDSGSAITGGVVCSAA